METTKERADQNIHDETVNHLQDLLVKNYDAEKGFKKSMEMVKSESLKHFLQKQAAQHSRFATELTDQLRNLNEEPREKGSITGDMHRAWIDIKTSVSGNKDESVLAECIRGEQASVEEYEEKMRAHHFPQQISSVLQRQSQEIQRTLSQVKEMDDLSNVA